MREEEKFLSVSGYKLYVRMFGPSDGDNIVCLHGGPGVPHQYMLPFTDLVSDGYQVILYDQLGVGKSDLPKNNALFTMERYVEDLEELRKELKLGDVHIIGNSCGGQLAIAYALKYQQNMRSMTLVGALANVPFVLEEMMRMRAKLPKEAVQTMKTHEERGEYDHPDYLKAVDVFYKKHVCRLKDWPQELNYSFEHLSRPVYHTMNGPNEFTIIGNIRYWNVTDRLPSIRVPTLVTCGRYDEVSPKEAKSISTHIRGSELVVFPRSSHLPFWEERKKFMEVQRAFLKRLERGRRDPEKLEEPRK